MNNYTEIRNKIRAMVGQKTPLLLTGRVESVSGETCTVSVGDLKLTDVRLRSVVNGRQSKLLITPKQGSYVTLIDLSGELRETEVLGYSEIEAIDIDTSGDIKINCKGDTNLDCGGTVTINGGDNEGLVKIEKLTEKLNQLVNTFNAHTHKVEVSHPGGVFTSITPSPTAEHFNRNQYEDIYVKH